ncbi:uncharacterized protein [Solanum lycopersicum]|uniref:uncharacterized protein n=1 Tax=Solanum lycopersicum TaxID=4081 RepID=UPI0037482A09
MAAPLNLEEGQSSTRTPRFNGHFYSWWKVRMHDFLMAEDSELWHIVLDGPFIQMIEEKDGEKTRLVPKHRQKYDEADIKNIEKGYKAKTLLVCGIGLDEFNRVSACESAKEILDCLKMTHEGTEQVKESKIDMLTSLYESFKMKKGETIHEMFTKLSSITNELRSLGEPISMSKQVRKALAAWGDSSSDSEDPDKPNDVSMVVVHEEETVFNEMFAFMAHTENEEEDDKLTSERDIMNAELSSLTENKVKLEEKMLKMEDKMASLESDNTELKKQLSQINEEAEKLNGRSNGLQVETEEKLKTTEIKSTLQGGGVSFGDGKKGYILGVGKVGKSLEESIDNVYHVDGLKYSLLSVSQIFDMGNEVKFTSEKSTVVSLTKKKVILTAFRSKNMYVANLETSHGDDLTCLSAQNENVDLWHRRLGHVSSSLLNKLISKDLVRGLPKLKFCEKICDTCVKGKQIRSSFKSKKK